MTGPFLQLTLILHMMIKLSSGCQGNGIYRHPFGINLVPFYLYFYIAHITVLYALYRFTIDEHMYSFIFSLTLRYSHCDHIGASTLIFNIHTLTQSY